MKVTWSLYISGQRYPTDLFGSENRVINVFEEVGANRIAEGAIPKWQCVDIRDETTRGLLVGGRDVS